MSFIPRFFRPQKEELSYSWIYRLADANNLNIGIFLDTYCGKHNASYGSLPVDARDELLDVLDHSRNRCDKSEWYNLMTTFIFESAFMTKKIQTRYINSSFMPKSRLNVPINGLFKKIKVCPECLKEDKYIRKQHQYSGVSVCLRHKCTLLEYNGIPGHEMDFLISDFSPLQSSISLDSRIAYAEYAEAISEIQCHAGLLRDAIFQAIKKSGYTPRTYPLLIDAIQKWKYADLFMEDIESFLRIKLISGDYLSAEEVIPFLMYFYPNPSDLKTIIAGKHTLLSFYTCDVCGTRYVSSPSAQQDGWGCPVCSAKMSEDELLKKVVYNIGKGQYTITGNFNGLDQKIAFHHNICGQDTLIKPREFIYGKVRCRCENVVTYETAKTNIENLGEFKLIKYKNTDSRCILYSENCGHTFSVSYRKFIESPRCRTCFPKNLTTDYLAERIKKSTNGEYELVGEFIDQDTKIKIRHTPCQKITEYKPRYYQSGAKCPFCSNKYADRWEKMFALLTEYYEEFKNTNIPKRDTYKGEKLGLWCERQRIAYRDKAKTLTDIRIQKLQSLSFDFDPLETEWNRRCDQYRRYIAIKNSPKISRRTDFENEHLGVWVETQQKQLAAGKLSPIRIQKLKNIGAIL